MLAVAMGRTTIPADGLDMAGARDRSAEDIVLEMRRHSDGSTRTRVWEGKVVTVRGRFGEGARGDEDAGDVLSERLERTLFPDDTTDPAREAEVTRELAARALGLARAFGARGAGRGSDAGGQQNLDVRSGESADAHTTMIPGSASPEVAQLVRSRTAQKASMDCGLSCSVGGPRGHSKA